MRWTEFELAQYQSRQRVLPDPSPERDWQAAVVGLAKQHGWRVYHPYDSRRSPEGYPDLTCCNGASVLFIECKTATGKLTPAQAQWLALLAHAGAETYVWRPADLPAVVERLSRR